MKVIFTEGSIHHLETMDIHMAPRIGENVVINNHVWTVESVTHLPKENGRNDNENCIGWDPDRDADVTVHLVNEE